MHDVLGAAQRFLGLFIGTAILVEQGERHEEARQGRIVHAHRLIDDIDSFLDELPGPDGITGGCL